MIMGYGLCVILYFLIYLYKHWVYIFDLYTEINNITE